MNEFWQWFDSYAYPRLSRRAEGFKKIFEYLDKFEKPVIIETGCVGDVENDETFWPDNGASTILFDKYVSHRNGQFLSVDIDNKRVENARTLINGHSEIICSDSVAFLTSYAKSDKPIPNLVYLDSLDLNWVLPGASQIHHFNELIAIFPKLAPTTLLVVDDSPFIFAEHQAVKGKGGLIGRYAHEIGVPLQFTEFQSAWLGFPGKANKLTAENFLLVIKIIDLIENSKWNEAEIVCDELIEKKQLLRDAYSFKGLVLHHRTEHEKAIEMLKLSLVHETGGRNLSIVKYYIALSLFSIGRHKEGWQFLFQSRLENENFSPLSTAIRRFAGLKKQLLTRQSPPAIVHVHTEAGFGDNLLLVRYLPLLAEKGYTVRYESRDLLAKLVQDSFPQVEVVPQADDFPGISGIKEFDYHLPIVDIPFIFQTDIDTIPWYGPYLKADPELTKKYEAYKGKIGICWSVNGPTRAKKRIDHNMNSYLFYKTIEFSQIEPIINLFPERFVSLQAGEARLDNGDGINFKIDDCLPRDERNLTFADTAALIENLDLIITVDTSVAHLAGGMGKPTWLMMHNHLTSFQFMCERPGAPWNTKSPWYPSMRIFRQKICGDWKPIIDAVVEELKCLK